MTEYTELISWGKAETFGKIPGSDWVCPTGSLDKLAAFERAGGQVTDETILDLAEGRRQHLELIRYPEGIHAAYVVDSLTGLLQPDHLRSIRYGGLTGPGQCRCGAHIGSPFTEPVLEYGPLDIGDDLQLVDVHGLTGGQASLFRPSAVPENDPDHQSRGLSSSFIDPPQQSYILEAVGSLPSVEGYSKINIRQMPSPKVAYRGPTADLTISGMRNSRLAAQLNVNLSADNRIVSMKAFGGYRRFLQLAGVQLDPATNPETSWATVTDYREQNIIMNAAAELLGLGPWRGLDFHSTAAGLYAALGQRNLQPTAYLIPALRGQ